MSYERSRRIASLPGNAFAELTRAKTRLRREGVQFLDLSEGIPDLEPDARLLDKLGVYCRKGELQGYPTRHGLPSLLRIARDYFSAFGIDMTTQSLLPGAGSKELIAHFAQAVIDPGDLVLVPELHYPFYRISAVYAGADVATYPLSTDGEYRPLLSELPEDFLRRAKLLWINSPHNPTGSVLDTDTLSEIAAIARKYDIIIASDLAYSRITRDPSGAQSLLAHSDPKQPAIEFHSMSKNLNIPGWRFAFALGEPHLLRWLEQSKSVFDTGIFMSIQMAVRYALIHFDEFCAPIRAEYTRRTDKISMALDRAGFEHVSPAGAFYIWARIPSPAPSVDYCLRLLEQCRVLALPGTVFGAAGEGYVRLALTQPLAVLEEAVSRVAEFDG